MLSKQEESFFAQKSRVRWLKDGDLNTSFFHNFVRSRFNINKVVSLTLEDGSRLYDSAGGKAFQQYFEWTVFSLPGEGLPLTVHQQAYFK